MRNWVVILLFTIGFGINAQSDNTVKTIALSDKDSIIETHFLPDDPFMAMLDSLYEADAFNNSDISYDLSVLNIHKFPLDSIPVYSDSIMHLRMQDLNTISPIEFIYNAKVKRFISVYGTHRRLMLSRVMGMSKLYFPIFEEELSKKDLPMELKYLPVVESALNNTARSRAGAVGMSQFMYRKGK